MRKGDKEEKGIMKSMSQMKIWKKSLFPISDFCACATTSRSKSCDSLGIHPTPNKIWNECHALGSLYFKTPLYHQKHQTASLLQQFIHSLKQLKIPYW